MISGNYEREPSRNEGEKDIGNDIPEMTVAVCKSEVVNEKKEEKFLCHFRSFATI